MNETRGLWHGKRVDNGEWAEGYLIRPQFNPNAAYIGYLFPTDGFVINVVEVDPSTLGECTGLRDKNGKLIFEGDIVEYDNVNYEIEYIEGFAAFSLRSVDNMSYAPRITTNTVPHMSVIGNIHDNPELLNGGRNGNNP